MTSVVTKENVQRQLSYVEWSMSNKCLEMCNVLHTTLTICLVLANHINQWVQIHVREHQGATIMTCPQRQFLSRKMWKFGWLLLRCKWGVAD